MEVDLKSEQIKGYLTEKFSEICTDHDLLSNRFIFFDHMNRRRRGKVIIESDDTGSLLYVLIIFFDAGSEQKTKEYLYNDGEWNNIRKLIGYSDIINDCLGLYIDNIETNRTEGLTEFEEKIERLNEKIRSESNALSLQDVNQHICNHNYDVLQNIVSEDVTDTVEFWKLLYSYDQNHAVVNNDISIEYENDTILFVRAVREYWNGSDKKEYPMGLIVGINDTPHKFFTHRIERCDKLNDSSYNWQLEDIREELGFIYDYADLQIDNKIPKQGTTRIQGDLAIRPLSINREKKRIMDFCIDFVKKELFKRHYKQYIESEFDSVSTHPKPYARQIIFDQDYSTNKLKEIQSKLCISEESVRREQQIKNIGRLSANLRQEIIKELFLEKFITAISNNTIPSDEFGSFNKNRYQQSAKSHLGKDLLYEKSLFNPVEFTRDKLYTTYDNRVNKLFTTKWGQYNEAHGNHLSIIESATTTPINRSRLFGRDQNRSDTVIVTNETELGVIHDEHDNRSYILEPGVYQFRFLDGFDPRNSIRW